MIFSDNNREYSLLNLHSPCSVHALNISYNTIKGQIYQESTAQSNDKCMKTTIKYLL